MQLIGLKRGRGLETFKVIFPCPLIIVACLFKSSIQAHLDILQVQFQTTNKVSPNFLQVEGLAFNLENRNTCEGQ